jgi:chromosome segregation ATPase
MRRPLLFALIAAIVVLLGVAAVLFVRYRKTTEEYTDMKAAEETARTGYAEAFKAVAEIQDSLNAIAIGDSTVRLLSQGLQAEQMLTEPHKRQALERVALLNASLQRNKERIRRLESDLKRNGVKVAGLEKMLGELKQTMAEKEALVSQLTVRADSLQTRVAGLEGEVQQNQETIRANEQTIEDKRREAATVYYAIGSKKELGQWGLTVARGGLLGIGRTLEPSGRYNETYFTALDTDHESVIRTTSAKVQVLSAQPAASYELAVVGGAMELHILDPKEFRKVKHVLLMTR